MRLIPIILFVTIGLFGCGAEDRIIEVLDTRAQAVPNARVTVLPGVDDASTPTTAITDVNGKAKFGTGTWDEVAEFISIKVEQSNVVLSDKVHAHPKGSAILIKANIPPIPKP